MCDCGNKCCSSCTCKSSEVNSGFERKKLRNLFCIVGKSASGKDSVARLLKERLGYKAVVSYTDRPMRDGETNGVEHYFVSRLEMDKLLERDDILAKTEINGNRYCATATSMDLDTKIYIIDPAGVEYLSPKAYDLGIKLTVFYIDVDDDIRYERAVKRGDNEDVIKKRFQSESEMFDNFHYDCAYNSKDVDMGFLFVYLNNLNLESLYVDVASEIKRLETRIN